MVYLVSLGERALRRALIAIPNAEVAVAFGTQINWFVLLANPAYPLFEYAAMFSHLWVAIAVPISKRIGNALSWSS